MFIENRKMDPVQIKADDPPLDWFREQMDKYKQQHVDLSRLRVQKHVGLLRATPACPLRPGVPRVKKKSRGVTRHQWNTFLRWVAHDTLMQHPCSAFFGQSQVGGSLRKLPIPTGPQTRCGRR